MDLLFLLIIFVIMRIEKKDIVYIDPGNNEILYYNKEKENRINSLLREEKLTFFLRKGAMGYYVEFCIIPEVEYVGNYILFEKANVNKFDFQNRILGYSMRFGGFPYCKTAEDALKLLNEVIKLLLK